MLSRLGSRYQALAPFWRRITLCCAGTFALCGVVFVTTGGGRDPMRADVALRPLVVHAIPSNRALEELLTDSLLGASGKVRARFVNGALANSYPGVDPRLGTKPGIVTVATPKGASFNFISIVPFAQKFGDRVGTYHVGFWPGELRPVRSDEYENPVGFVEVTGENELTRVSEHFVLRDFITRDQQKSWPKYVVLQEALLDKLELVILELDRSGHRVQNVKVLSGFRTPYHNLYGIGSEGGARDSRHQYGDAADVIIDNNRDGRMDDLNRDGRVDVRDLEIVLSAVERVERNHPDLVGGLGKYLEIGPSGPFAHIDVRGYRARWNNEPRRTVTATAASAQLGGSKGAGAATPVGRCWASPEFASLCGKGGER